jgi:pyruvate dehydrogenase E2 component (dihydrolipoamide acetyltransferase)
MPSTLTMPKLSPTMELGTIVKWNKKIGDHVEVGDLLVEVATDKATVEYQAIDAGWLRKIVVEEGQEVSVNDPIAIFTDTEKESLDGYKMPEKKAPVPLDAVKEERTVPDEGGTEQGKPKNSSVQWTQPAFLPEPPPESFAFPYPRGAPEGRVLASPLAKKLAKENGLDLSSVKGTGPNQRIVSKDLERAQPAGSVGFGVGEIPTVPPGTYEEKKLSPVRKLVGQRLQESKSFIPHFYVRQEIDAAALAAVREQLKQGHVKVTINDLIVRACALSLRQHPEVNCGFNSVSQSIIEFKTVDISIAVNGELGLVTPIVRHADYKNLGELAIEIRALAQRAKVGKLEAHEYKGGAFTISNLGMHGVTDFQAIINPPQAAILAVSGIREVPVVRNNLVVPGQIMNVTLSVDHRVIDGVAAALFLKTLKGFLENPALLLLT